jgi:hypothetical protein
MNLRHEINYFTSPVKDVLRIFIALKYPLPSVRLEPATTGSSGKHATPRPPKVTMFSSVAENFYPFCID